MSACVRNRGMSSAIDRLIRVTAFVGFEWPKHLSGCGCCGLNEQSFPSQAVFVPLDMLCTLQPPRVHAREI